MHPGQQDEEKHQDQQEQSGFVPGQDQDEFNAFSIDKSKEEPLKGDGKSTEEVAERTEQFRANRAVQSSSEQTERTEQCKKDRDELQQRMRLEESKRANLVEGAGAAVCTAGISCHEDDFECNHLPMPSHQGRETATGGQETATGKSGSRDPSKPTGSRYTGSRSSGAKSGGFVAHSPAERGGVEELGEEETGMQGVVAPGGSAGAAEVSAPDPNADTMQPLSSAYGTAAHGPAMEGGGARGDGLKDVDVRDVLVGSPVSATLPPGAPSQQEGASGNNGSGMKGGVSSTAAATEPAGAQGQKAFEGWEEGAGLSQVPPPKQMQGQAEHPSAADLQAQRTVDKLKLMPHTRFIPTALVHGIDFTPAFGEEVSASYEAGPELRASGHLGTPPLFSDTSRQQQQQQTNAQATPETDWLDKPGLVGGIPIAGVHRGGSGGGLLHLRQKEEAAAALAGLEDAQDANQVAGSMGAAAASSTINEAAQASVVASGSTQPSSNATWAAEVSPTGGVVNMAPAGEEPAYPQRFVTAVGGLVEVPTTGNLGARPLITSLPVPGTASKWGAGGGGAADYISIAERAARSNEGEVGAVGSVGAGGGSIGSEGTDLFIPEAKGADINMHVARAVTPEVVQDTAEDYLQAAPPPSTVVQPLMERELLAAVESNKQAPRAYASRGLDYATAGNSRRLVTSSDSKSPDTRQGEQTEGVGDPVLPLAVDEGVPGASHVSDSLGSGYEASMSSDLVQGGTGSGLAGRIFTRDQRAEPATALPDLQALGLAHDTDQVSAPGTNIGQRQQPQSTREFGVEEVSASPTS